MKDLRAFLERMGGLHDSAVTQMLWQPELRRLRFEIDDMCSNFRGLPEYVRAVPGFVELAGVTNLRLEVATMEARLNVYEFKVDEGDATKVTVAFWPAGLVAVSFSTADHTDVALGATE